MAPVSMFGHGLRARLGFLSLLLVPAALVHAQTPGDQAGVRADGSIRYLFRICSTCDTPSDDLFDETAGGPGSTGPAIVDGFAARGTGTASVDARALLVGPMVLPELRADARSMPGIGSHEGFSGDGVYDFTSVAIAAGRQYYRYLGTEEQHYAVTYTVSGDARSLLDEPTAFDESLIGVYASLGLYDDGDKLNGERPLGGQIDIASSSFNGAQHAFRETRTVSATLMPGGAFYLEATLSAQVLAGGYGMADASQTMRVEFTAGDTSLLLPLLAPVPEPSSWALMALGVTLTMLAVRRWPPRILRHELSPTSGCLRAPS